MATKLTTGKRIAETSSKGNQEKWRESGRWYKLDLFGYEGLAETVPCLCSLPQLFFGNFHIKFFFQLFQNICVVKINGNFFLCKDLFTGNKLASFDKIFIRSDNIFINIIF